jgi:hypothetical protein
LIGSFQTITIHGTSGSTSSTVSGRPISTGAVLALVIGFAYSL